MTYVIAEPCVGCKDSACVKACPVEAIFKDDLVPEQWAGFIAKNKNFFGA